VEEACVITIGISQALYTDIFH